MKDIRALFAGPEAEAASHEASARAASSAAREALEVAAARGVPEGEPRRVALASDVRRTPAVDALVAVVRRRASRPDSSVVVTLSGPPRCGITCAGCWLVMRCFGDAVRMTAGAVASVPDGDYSDHVVARHEQRAPRVVFLDDVGRERLGPRSAARVAEFVLDRAERPGTVTVLGTGLASAEFLARYFMGSDGKVTPRMRQMRDRQRSELGLEWWWRMPEGSFDRPDAVAALPTFRSPPNPRRA